jgi:hypothetical protein
MGLDAGGEEKLQVRRETREEIRQFRFIVSHGLTDYFSRVMIYDNADYTSKLDISSHMPVEVLLKSLEPGFDK